MSCLLRIAQLANACDRALVAWKARIAASERDSSMKHTLAQISAKYAWEDWYRALTMFAAGKTMEATASLQRARANAAAWDDDSIEMEALALLRRHEQTHP